MKTYKNCNQRIKPLKGNFTREEWNKLKKGSILSGKKYYRKVIKRRKNSQYITFAKISEPTKTTTYTFIDLYKKYFIKKF